MATTNHRKERVVETAKNVPNEPRWLRSSVSATSFITLAAIAMLLIARETGHVGLAWAGLASFLVGTVGWFVAFGRLVVWRVQEVWNIRDSYAATLGKMFNRGVNRQIDADSE